MIFSPVYLSVCLSLLAMSGACIVLAGTAEVRGKGLKGIGLTVVIPLFSTFINKVFNFVGIGTALYTVALIYGWASNDSVIKHTVKCKYCRKRISEKVSCCSSFPPYLQCLILTF